MELMEAHELRQRLENLRGTGTQMHNIEEVIDDGDEEGDDDGMDIDQSNPVNRSHAHENAACGSGDRLAPPGLRPCRVPARANDPQRDAQLVLENGLGLPVEESGATSFVIKVEKIKGLQFYM